MGFVIILKTENEIESGFTKENEIEIGFMKENDN